MSGGKQPHNEVLAAAVAEAFGLDPVDVEDVLEQADVKYYGYTDNQMRAAVNAALKDSDPEDVAAAIAAAILRVRDQGREAS